MRILYAAKLSQSIHTRLLYAKYVTVKQDVKFLFRNNVVKLVSDANAIFTIQYLLI